MKFTLTNYQLNLLQEKSKLYSYMYNVFTQAYFKVDTNAFTFMLRGNTGVLQTTIPIDYNDEPVYYSLEYSKWQTTLQKYADLESITLTINKNALKISSSETKDAISLSLNRYSAGSNEATILDNFINIKKQEILQDNRCLVLNEELLENLSFVDTLFTAQGKVNAVGLGRKDVTYSDRSIVLKAYLSEQLPDELFDSLNSEDYIYLHTSVIKLLPLLFKSKENIYFSKDYGILYWADDNTEIYMVSFDREVALPTEEEFKSIQPTTGSPSFDVKTDVLKECLDFFTGFYEGSAWKPITFNIAANKEISLYYRHPSTEVEKTIPDACCDKDGSFMVDSETLKKVITKIGDRTQGKDVTFVFDEDSPGVYLNVENAYEVVFSKLSEG